MKDPARFTSLAFKSDHLMGDQLWSDEGVGHAYDGSQTACGRAPHVYDARVQPSVNGWFFYPDALIHREVTCKVCRRALGLTAAAENDWPE